MVCSFPASSDRQRRGSTPIEFSTVKLGEMSPLNRAILLAVLVVYPCLGGLMAQAANQQPASRVCRPGPPLRPPTDGRKNCLVIGDSVSLGYTPYVVTMLNKTCQVQHAPFSSDGGMAVTQPHNQVLVCMNTVLMFSSVLLR